jgi:hypothetical protein
VINYLATMSVADSSALATFPFHAYNYIIIIIIISNSLPNTQQISASSTVLKLVRGIIRSLLHPVIITRLFVLLSLALGHIGAVPNLNVAILILELNIGPVLQLKPSNAVSFSYSSVCILSSTNWQVRHSPI